MSGVFDEAYAAVEHVDDIVTQRIEDAVSSSESLQATALSTIDALSGVNFDFNGPPPPSPPNIDPNIQVDLTLPQITPTSFGSITSNIPERPATETVPDIPDADIPEFTSSIGSLNIPNAPSWTAPSAAPERPDVDDAVIPDAPVLALPPLPDLSDVVVPDFAGLTLPVFDATAPEFEGTALTGILQWEEPTYYPEILDEVLVVIRRMWAGGLGIPEAVEQAMVDRAAEREDVLVRQNIDAVDSEFSSRGFTMPTGMQAARTDAIRQELTLKKLSLNREMTVEFAKIQVENVRFACEQAIAAENVLVNIFLNMANRVFEAAKLRLMSQIDIYNAQVAVFNAKMNSYQIQASVYDTLVRAELANIEVFKAEVEAELAKGKLNEQKVATYTARIQALNSTVEIYKAEMQGASLQTDISRARIEAYKADVQAYAERIQADKVRFDAYDSQVKGEATKAGIIDSEARAYAALVQGKSAAADVNIKRAEAVIQKNRDLMQAYVADLDAEKTRIQSQVAVIQAGAQAYTADTQRYVAVATAETAKANVTISAKEAELRTNVAFYQAQVQAYLGNMEQLIRQAALVIDALKAAGSISSTLAAGAMAGVHVGANLSGGASVSASGSDSFSESISTSTSHSTSESTSYDGGQI